MIRREFLAAFASVAYGAGKIDAPTRSAKVVKLCKPYCDAGIAPGGGDNKSSSAGYVCRIDL